MPRKKSSNPDEVLTHFVRTRVTDKVYNRLDKTRLNSDCHSIGGVARKLLSQEKITLFYKDMTLIAAMEELALIRKEIRALGLISTRSLAVSTRTKLKRTRHFMR